VELTVATDKGPGDFMTFSLPIEESIKDFEEAPLFSSFAEEIGNNQADSLSDERQQNLPKTDLDMSVSYVNVNTSLTLEINTLHKNEKEASVHTTEQLQTVLPPTSSVNANNLLLDLPSSTERIEAPEIIYEKNAITAFSEKRPLTDVQGGLTVSELAEVSQTNMMPELNVSSTGQNQNEEAKLAVQAIPEEMLLGKYFMSFAEAKGS